MSRALRPFHTVALAVVFFCAMRPTPAIGATLYVDAQISSTACTNYNPAARSCGSGAALAYKTLGGANLAVQAGDTVVVRAGTYNERLSPARSGTATQPIVYRRSGSEQVLLTAVPAISLSTRAYITVDGFTVRVSGCAGACYVYLNNSHHVTVQNSRMDQSLNQNGWVHGVWLENNSHHNRILNNVIAKVGYSTTDDIGGVLLIGSHNASDKTDFNLIEGNTIFHGGHHLMELSGNYNIIRGNYFHNEEWMPCARTQTGGMCGNRLIGIDGPSSNARYNVLEDNIFAFSGLPPDNAGSSGVSVRTGYTIIRRNVFLENDLAGLTIATLAYTFGFTPPHDVRFNHVFHNVFFHNAFSALGPTYKPFEAGISMQNHDGPAITDVTVKNNIMWQNRWQQAIAYYNVDAASQRVSSNWAETGDPLFLNDEATPDPLNPALLDFHLQSGSPAIDAGAFLTRTTSAGSGTQIVVEDAMFFIDGFGIIAGDLVQLQGQSSTVRVVAVDYVLKRITIDTPLTWQSGQGVTLPYRGTAPDLGAFEHGLGSTSPAPPTNVRVIR